MLTVRPSSSPVSWKIETVFMGGSFGRFVGGKVGKPHRLPVRCGFPCRLVRVRFVADALLELRLGRVVQCFPVSREVLSRRAAEVFHDFGQCCVCHLFSLSLGRFRLGVVGLGVALVFAHGHDPENQQTVANGVLGGYGSVQLPRGVADQVRCPTCFVLVARVRNARRPIARRLVSVRVKGRDHAGQLFSEPVGPGRFAVSGDAEAFSELQGSVVSLRFGHVGFLPGRFESCG